MAVEHKTEPLLKSYPDVSKLNTFTGYTATVTKHQAPRNSPGTMIVPTQQMTKEQVLALQTSLPLNHGPGFYRFEVSDTGGSGSDAWMSKLGPETPPQEAYMAGPPYPTTSPGAPVQLSEGVRQIGPGFFYDEGLGTLVTRWGEVVQWRPGEPLPKAPSNPQQPGLSLVPPNANPGTWSPWGSGWPSTGWGGYPVNDGDSSKVRELETRLAEETRRREMDEMRAEQRRRDEETRRLIEDQNRRFETLVEKLTTRPSGPSEETQRLQREVEEQRRRMEDRDREDRIRADMRAQQERMDAALRELSANKSDPMLPILLQMMQSSQASAQESVKAIREATSNASTSAERSIQQMLTQLQATMMNPAQLFQLVESARASGNEGSNMIVQSMKTSLDMQRDVFSQLLDVAGQNNQSPWVTIVQDTLQKVGEVGKVLAERAGQQQQQQPQRVVSRPMPVAGAPNTPRRQAIPPGAPAAAPINGTNGTAHAAAAAPPAAAPAPKAKRGKGGKRGRPRRQPAAEQNTQAPTPPSPPPPGGYTIEQIREMTPAVVREGIKPFSDADFFGEIMPYVEQIRQGVAAGTMKPEAIAEVLLSNRGYIQQMKVMPPAGEILFADHFEVLIERLLPGVPEEYRAAVVESIHTQIEAEDEGDEDDEDEEEEAEAGG